MSIYEDPDYIDQLSDEAIAEDQRRKQAIEYTYQAINTLPSPGLKIVLRMMMSLITKTH